MIRNRREWLFLDQLFGGVTRAYDVFRNMRKYPRGMIPPLLLRIRTEKVTNVVGLSSPKIAMKSNVGLKIC